MKVINGIDNYSGGPVCLTVGTFDGLHLGHKKIISTLVELSKKYNLQPTVLTFDPHPRQVLFVDKRLDLLFSPNEKISLFQDLGVSNLIVHPFDKQFASLTCYQFMQKLLVEKLSMRHLVMGFNNHFGCDRLNNPNLLDEYANKLGFGITRVSPQSTLGENVSSTIIRQAIKEGDVEKAANMLGFFFFISGKVVEGKHIGRTIGFPTANVSIDFSHKMLPKAGVYAAIAILEQKKYLAMLNIGSNPTVNDCLDKVFVEAHLLDFDGVLYGEKIKLQIVKRMRDEQHFLSVNQLAQALKIDKDNILNFFAKNSLI